VKESSILYDENEQEIYRQDYSVPLLIMDAPNKMFRKIMYSHTPALKDSDLGKWYRLVKHLEQNTNRLVMRELDKTTGWVRLKHRPLDIDDLVEIFKSSKSSVYNFLSECEEDGYIRKWGDAYYMSPLYVMNGAGVSVELYLIFRDVEEFIENLTKRDKAVINAYLNTDRVSGDKNED